MLVSVFSLTSVLNAFPVLQISEVYWVIIFRAVVASSQNPY